MEIKVPNEVELKDIFIDIHCMGKNPQGEGILIVIKKDDYIIYSALIDEYISKKILENEKIKHFDLICWSHPHDDHADGLKEMIKKYTTKKTKIMVPTGISDVKKYMTKKCKKTYNPIRRINKHNKKLNGEYIEVNQYTVLLENTYVDINGRTLKLKIRAISPISKRVNNMRNNKNCNMNDLSISLLISINEISFLFSSDIYNAVIGDMEINSKEFENIIYYKIPHHGSSGADNLLLYVPDSNDNRLAVSTIYKKNGQDKTPNIELLNKYMNKGLKVYCTDKSYLNGSKNIEDYGIVSTRVKINNSEHKDELDWDIKFEGEATEVIKESKEIVFIPNN